MARAGFNSSCILFVMNMHSELVDKYSGPGHFEGVWCIGIGGERGLITHDALNILSPRIRVEGRKSQTADAIIAHRDAIELSPSVRINESSTKSPVDSVEKIKNNAKWDINPGRDYFAISYAARC